MLRWDTYKYDENETLLEGVRWAREDEIKVNLKKTVLAGAGPAYAGLPVISDGNTVYVDDSDAHSLIIGSTGSKKTRLFAMPMLELFRRAGESVLVTDPKGELYNLSSRWFADAGYQVDVINLREPDKSSGWNPLMLARTLFTNGDTERAATIVNDFAHAFIPDSPGSKADPFWTYTARSILRGLCFMLTEGGKIIPEEYVNIKSLKALSDKLNPDLERNTFQLADFYPEDSLARSNLYSVINGTDRTFDNIKVSYESSVQKLYIQKSLMNLLSRNDVDFSDLGKRKTVLYLIMPDEKTTLHFLVSMIIKQCYEMLITLAQDSPSQSLPVRVNFLLDEFSNLPAIPDISAMISAARSRNIRFHLIIQGLYQLSSKYGPEDAQTIKGNCVNWAFLTSRELPLLEEISQLCGTDSLTGKRLISISQLQRLDKFSGEVLMLIGRNYPYIAHLADISQYRLPEKKEPLPLPAVSSAEIPYINPEEVLMKLRYTVAPPDPLRKYW